MTIRGHQLGMDWSRHGTYANTTEDITTPGTYYLDDNEVVIAWGRGESRATEDAVVAKLSASLNNVDRVFSPENSASPITGKILPGVPVRYQVTDSATGAITTLFGPGPMSEFDADSTTKTFQFDAIDFAWTDNTSTGTDGVGELSTPVYQGQRTGYLIGVILDTIGWTGPRDLDAGATVVDWWWAENEDAWAAINRLVDSEGPPAIAYVEGGTFTFRDRHHRQFDTNSVTSQGTFTYTIPAGAVAGDHKILAGSFSYDHGLKFIVNSVTLSVDQRVPQDVTAVWSTDSPFTLAAGETQTFFVQTEQPFINAVTPVLDTDFSLVGGSLTVSLSRTSGRSVILTLTAGGSSTFVTSLQLRASLITVVRTYKVAAEDASSVGTFGRRTWPGTMSWANRFDAQAIATRVVAVYAQPRPTVTLSVANITAATQTRILNTRVSDRITIRNDEIGLNRDFYVESIEHKITKLGLIHTLTIGCQVVEPSRGTTEITFDVAGQGFNQGVFGIDGIDVPGSEFRFDVAGQGFDQGRYSS